MSELLDLRHQFDPTGQSPDNRIVDELHTVSQSGPALIIPREGLMYTPNFSIRRATTQTPLTLGADYHFVSLDQYITAQTGIEAASAIQLDRNGLYGDFVITYQAVGGYEGRFNRLVQDLIEAIDTAKDSPVEWARIRNKPTQYPPDYHNHELTTITGWEAMTTKLHSLRDAILDTRSLSSSALALKQADERILNLLAGLQRDTLILSSQYSALTQRLSGVMEFDFDMGELDQSSKHPDRDVLTVASIDLDETSQSPTDFGVLGREPSEWEGRVVSQIQDPGEL